MDLFAGTSKGVFQIADGRAKKVLDCAGVREIICFNGRIFAGTGNGLYVSDDGGASWLFYFHTSAMAAVPSLLMGFRCWS